MKTRLLKRLRHEASRMFAISGTNGPIEIRYNVYENFKSTSTSCPIAIVGSFDTEEEAIECKNKLVRDHIISQLKWRRLFNSKHSKHGKSR